MVWNVQIEKRAIKVLAKLGPVAQGLIQDYINTQLIPCEDPRSFGKALGGNKRGLWRYRVHKYRMICRIVDNKLLILVLEIGKRDKIYD